MYDEGLGEDSRKGLEIILKEAKRLTNMVEECLILPGLRMGALPSA
jgi:hypothetical protein